MRRNILLYSSILLLIITLVAGSSAPSVSEVRADGLLQGLPGLDGKIVYFASSSSEANRYDRSEAGLSRFASLLHILGANLFTLDWQNGIPADADLIIIAGPTEDSQAEIAWLWSYLEHGGRLLLLVDPLSRVHSMQRGLFELTWVDMGFRARDDIVATEGSVQTFSPAPAWTSEGEPTSTPAPSFEAPSLLTEFTTSHLAQHPITAGIESGLTFFGTRSIEVDETPSRSITVTSLVFSGSDFYGETAYQEYLSGYGAEYNIEEDTTRGTLVLAAAIENSATGSRTVLIGDREFATNGGGLQTSPPYSPSFLYPDNIRFLLNAVAWLVEAEGDLVDIPFPTPGSTATPTSTLSPTPTPTSEEGTNP
jgi:hypothetical protein